MSATVKKLQDLMEPMFRIRPYAEVIADIARTAKSYRKQDGHVRINRVTGEWSWTARAAATAVDLNYVTLSFRADYRRDDVGLVREHMTREVVRAREILGLE